MKNAVLAWQGIGVECTVIPEDSWTVCSIDCSWLSHM